MPERFRRGDIVLYPYLWRWQAEDNPDREHGEKDRPVCMILTVTDKEGFDASPASANLLEASLRYANRA